jgi:molybdopterin biosynthesis enzyme
MTGAPVPDGSDMVIRVEDTEINDDGRVVIHVKGKDKQYPSCRERI